MHELRIFFIGILSFLALAACNKSETEELDRDYGYDYFPLQIGREYLYEIDSIVFRETAAGIQTDTSRTWLLERIVDSLEDNSGQVLYRIERFERKGTDAPWEIKNVWTAGRTDRQALRTEDNLRFIKLVFPLRAGESWKGNGYIPAGIFFEGSSRQVEIFKEWAYQVLSVDEPATVGKLSFDRVVTVANADFESIIEYRYAREQYARGIGLIYREWRILDTQCRYCCGGDTGDACQSLSWEQKGENGFILRQRLISFN